jgi:hypothetical protein
LDRLLRTRSERAESDGPGGAVKGKESFVRSWVERGEGKDKEMEKDGSVDIVDKGNDKEKTRGKGKGKGKSTMDKDADRFAVSEDVMGNGKRKRSDKTVLNEGEGEIGAGPVQKR